MSKPKDVVNFRNRIKTALVVASGNECQVCHIQYPNSVYEFHHLNPDTKSFGLACGSTTRAKSAYADEAKKCILVCANCHRLIEHEGLDVSNLKSQFDEAKYYQVLDDLTQKNRQKKIERPKYISPKPERDILKQDIYNLPMVQVGNKYGVTDNAIRKWCKSYNLPSRKTDINKYSLEEWELI